MIYFIKSESGHVKIGHTENNVKDRLASLQTGNQFKLSLLKVIDGDLEQEKLLHNKYWVWGFSNSEKTLLTS